MQREYWRQAHRRALSGTIKLLGLDSLGQIVFRAVLAIGVIVVLIWFGSDDAATDEIISKAAKIALVLIFILPVTYFSKLALTPAKLHAEAKQRELAIFEQLQAELDAPIGVERRAMAENRARLRIELITKLGHIRAMAGTYRNWNNSQDILSRIEKNAEEAHALIAQLTDNELRILCNDLIQHAWLIIFHDRDRLDSRDVRREFARIADEVFPRLTKIQ